MANFFQIGLALGVAASVAWVSWPSWKPDWAMPKVPAWTPSLPVDSTSPEPVQTELYTWTDAQGVVHYSQESEGHAKAIRVDTGKITPLAAVELESLRAPVKASAGQNLRQNMQQAQEQQLKLRMQGSGVE